LDGIDRIYGMGKGKAVSREAAKHAKEEGRLTG
jgi:hypothetical protein